MQGDGNYARMKFLHFCARRRRWRRHGHLTVGALALVLAASVALAASEGDGGAAPATPEAVATGANCGSLVIRNCRLRLPSVLAGSGEQVLGGAPSQWEAVHIAGPDSDEILVTGERIREPTPSEVFERYLGSPAGSTSMITRTALGGARCTTISRSGATLCSSSGGMLPGMGTPVTTWSFSF